MEKKFKEIKKFCESKGYILTDSRKIDRQLCIDIKCGYLTDVEYMALKLVITPLEIAIKVKEETGTLFIIVYNA
jgi:hypothetical protein